MPREVSKGMLRRSSVACLDQQWGMLCNWVKGRIARGSEEPKSPVSKYAVLVTICRPFDPDRACGTDAIARRDGVIAQCIHAPIQPRFRLVHAS